MEARAKEGKFMEGKSHSKAIFLRELGESTLALMSSSSINLIGGIVFSSFLDIYAMTSWSIAVFPCLVSMRGAIGGLLCNHLSTGLHIGTIKASYTKNTKNFYSLMYASVVLTTCSSIAMSTIAWVFNGLLFGFSIATLVEITGVMVSTMAIALMLIMPFTTFIAFTSFKKGLDPDIMTYPIESSVADTFIVCVYGLNLYLLGSSPIYSFFIYFITCLLLVLSLYLLFKKMKEEEFRKTVRESLLSLTVSAFMVNISGLFLEKVTGIIGRSLVEVYLIYPILIDSIGDVGSIVGSTATTKLVQGTLVPSLRSIKNHSGEIVAAWLGSLIAESIGVIISLIMYGGIASIDRTVKIISILYLANIQAALVIALLSFVIAIKAYKRGWDPSNFVIPIESCMADSAATIALFTSVTLIVSILR